MPSCNCKQCGDKCDITIAKIVKWLRCFSTISPYVEDTTATAYAQMFADKIEAGVWQQEMETQPAIRTSDVKAILKSNGNDPDSQR